MAAQPSCLSFCICESMASVDRGVPYGGVVLIVLLGNSPDSGDVTRRWDPWIGFDILCPARWHCWMTLLVKDQGATFHGNVTSCGRKVLWTASNMEACPNRGSLCQQLKILTAFCARQNIEWSRIHNGIPSSLPMNGRDWNGILSIAEKGRRIWSKIIERQKGCKGE